MTLGAGSPTPTQPHLTTTTDRTTTVHTRPMFGNWFGGGEPEPPAPTVNAYEYAQPTRQTGALAGPHHTHTTPHFSAARLHLNHL